MLNALRKLYTSSVFRRSTPVEQNDPVTILVLMFHRGSAVTYFIIFAWSIVSLIYGIQSIVTAWGAVAQEVYSVAVAATAAFSWVGASYFPRFARYELYSSSSLMLLLAGYTLVLGQLSWMEGALWYPLMFFSMITFVVPVTRVVFIYKTLLAEAARKASS